MTLSKLTKAWVDAEKARVDELTKRGDPMTYFTQEKIEKLRNAYACLEHQTHEVSRLLKALDEIERQRERIAELEQERRWISVSERLPEESGEYWVCYFYDGKTVQGYCEYKLEEGFENLMAWDNTEIVTHWQPLPQSPQEEE
jgi:hypothetical protein